jgi:hypothetical protein
MHRETAASGKNIERLSDELRAFEDENPEVYGLLRFTPNLFDATTVAAWHARGWEHVKQSEIGPLTGGNDVERLAAMLRLLHPYGIRRVEFASGRDRLEIVPLVARSAAA